MKILLILWLFCTNPYRDDTSEVVITRIVDGDTYAFLLDSEEVFVRLLGFDCFETKMNKRLRKQADDAGISPDSALALGVMQRGRAVRYLLNKKVLIVRDRRERNIDVYQRLLRHVIINGKNFKEILRKF